MPKEFEIIDYFRKNSHITGEHLIKGPGDDMAVMKVGGEELLITADTLLEGVHFDLSTATLEQVGYKAMACSLSDCAAMCSSPIGAIGCTSFPTYLTMAQIEQLHSGVQKAARKYNCPIIGGDVTSWDNPLAISITMFSVMKNGRKPVYRSGAVVGDRIMVTGKLGGSIKGRHLTFEPRIKESELIYDNSDLHSMMDISDGLAGDLRHICKESEVSAILDHALIPYSDEVSTNNDPVSNALSDGEDFELLFTVSENDSVNLLKEWPYTNVSLTVIGEIIPQVNGPEIFIKKNNEKLLFTGTGWEHLTK